MHYLGINTGFAVNRFQEHEEWTRIIAEDFELKYVQLSADSIPMGLPPNLLRSQIQKIQTATRKYHLNIVGTFTGYFTRVNHLTHPDAEIRKYYLDWFKTYVDVSVDLGAQSMGSHLGILTAKECANPTLREEREKHAIEAWHSIADYAKKRGLQYLVWEPMSVAREFGETLSEAQRLHQKLNESAAIPFYFCLDVDHGDVSSKNPADYDHVAWLNQFGTQSPLIHIKQSQINKSGHWPFTRQYNENGKIVPQDLLSLLNTLKSPLKDRFLLFELNFREREPADSSAIAAIKESVAYWRQCPELS